MSLEPTDRYHIDVLNEAADLYPTSQVYHKAVDRDKSVTAKEVRKLVRGTSPDCLSADLTAAALSESVIISTLILHYNVLIISQV